MVQLVLGHDLPAKDCPHCGHAPQGCKQDIPFETFLGFYGDKSDIDLNFLWGLSTARPRLPFKELGEDYVYRAGTISTVAERTAGYQRLLRGLTILTTS